MVPNQENKIRFVTLVLWLGSRMGLMALTSLANMSSLSLLTRTVLGKSSLMKMPVPTREFALLRTALRS